MAHDENGPLQPKLNEVQQEIEERVQQVCNAPSADKLDTGELIRYEENLAIAADRAKQAVSLRRRMRADKSREGSTALPPTPHSEPPASEASA